MDTEVESADAGVRQHDGAIRVSPDCQDFFGFLIRFVNLFEGWVEFFIGDRRRVVEEEDVLENGVVL